MEVTHDLHVLSWDGAEDAPASCHRRLISPHRRTHNVLAGFCCIAATLQPRLRCLSSPGGSDWQVMLGGTCLVWSNLLQKFTKGRLNFGWHVVMWRCNEVSQLLHSAQCRSVSLSCQDSAVHLHLKDKGHTLTTIMYSFWTEKMEGLWEELKKPSVTDGEEKPTWNWGGGPGFTYPALVERFTAALSVSPSFMWPTLAPTTEDSNDPRELRGEIFIWLQQLLCCVILHHLHQYTCKL